MSSMAPAGDSAKDANLGQVSAGWDSELVAKLWANVEVNPVRDEPLIVSSNPILSRLLDDSP